MSEKIKCGYCNGRGSIIGLLHIDNGKCWRCSGTGKTNKVSDPFNLNMGTCHKLAKDDRVFLFHEESHGVVVYRLMSGRVTIEHDLAEAYPNNLTMTEVSRRFYQDLVKKGFVKIN